MNKWTIDKNIDAFEASRKARIEARNQFLNAPQHLKAPVKCLLKLEEASELFNKCRYTLDLDILAEEAKYSAAIESEFDPIRIIRHISALVDLINGPVDLDTLLKAHEVMMEGQSHAQPGQLRNVNVTVGNHVAPHYTLVSSYIDNLYNYLVNSDDHPLIKAAWGHLQFETIHPFADGNGRTGRGIINQVLHSYFPLSAYIYKNRLMYYTILDRGNWDNYLEWFLDGVIIVARDIKNG